MGTIAKSSITLTSISDAYSVSLTPSTCVIHADYDGSNPILDNAYTLISVYCGEEKVPITIDARNIVVSAGITCNLSKVDDFTYKLKVDRLVNTLMQGTVDIKVNANNYTTLSARFLFSVERESTMLDWIQDWEKNKTTIGNSYVITPKIFVGKNIPDGGDVGLTGVYIGPAGVTGDSTGVFGYKNSIEIFRLDENGGKIGGWTINRDGLYSENGRMKILSTGSIEAIDGVGTVIWNVKESGDATFAKGNVHFLANGNADFKGKITSAEGSIGGWTINKQELFNGVVGLDAVRHQIGIVNMNRTSFLPLEFSYKQLAMVGGGVVMYYNSNTDYGMYGGNASGCTFQLGTTNMIAGWNFDQNALWMGTKNNNVQQYTSVDGYITLGTAGLRGCSWYIDKDGTASFVKGLVKFNQTSGEIVGWTLSANSFYRGAEKNSAGLFTNNSGDITIGSQGIRGYKWRLDSNGSGSLAGGNIKWEADGKATLSKSVVLQWGTNTGSLDSVLTHIDANGIYTGTLTAQQVNALTCTFDKGTIGGWTINANSITKNNVSLGADGAITNGNYWKLNSNGSGSLAGGNIKWEADGNIAIIGKITATSGKIGYFEIEGGYLGLDGYYNTSANGMWLNNNVLGFNGAAELQAMFGLIDNYYTGTYGFLRLIDTRELNLENKYGIIQRLAGSKSSWGNMGKTVAFQMDGGCIEGFAIKTEVFAWGNVPQQNNNGTYTQPPSRRDTTINRMTGSFYVSTQYTWVKITGYTNPKDKYVTKTCDVYVTLPTMRPEDDGHVIKIKRAPNNNNTVHIIPGDHECWDFDSSLGLYGEYKKNVYKTYIICDNATYVNEYAENKTRQLASEGDAITLVFHKNIGVTYSDSNGNLKAEFRGGWIEYKHPRTW